MFSKEDYKEMFYELMNQYEFKVYRATNEDGKECLKLKDLQGGNLGNIESREYKDFAEILDDLDIYHNDYLVKYVSNCVYDYCDSNASYKELADTYFKHINEFDGDCEWEARMLDMVAHSNKLKGVVA